jgi:hypothetical protein
MRIQLPIAGALFVVLSGCGPSQQDEQASHDGGTSITDGESSPSTFAGHTSAPSSTATGSTGVRSSSTPSTHASGASTSPTSTSAHSSSMVVQNVAPCPSGSGTANVGVWENITPPQFATPSNLESIVVGVNPQDESVYAAAGNVTNGGNPPIGTGIYKSVDCGASWKKVSTGRGSAALATGDVWSMRIDFNTPTTMYAANGYGDNTTLFKTTDGAVDWDPLTPDSENTLVDHNSFVQAVGMDPANPLHLAVSFHENCSSPHTPLCLSETDDGGMTWHIMNGPPTLTQWEEAASVTVLGPTSYLFTCTSNGVFYTADSGQTWTRVITQGTMQNYGGGAYLAPDGNLYLGVTNTGTFVSKPSASSPLGSSWTPIPNSPPATCLISDGVSLYASYSWDSGGQPFYSAPLKSIASWTHMPSPSVGRGGSMVDYDAAHHIIYSANLGAGMWRLTTR